MNKSLPFDHQRWGNRIVVNRSLDLWREYGAETGLFELQKGWSRFLFARDARDLALVPRTLAAKADEISSHEFSMGIPLRGREMYQQYTNHRDIGQRELNAWKNAFIGAYSEQIEELVKDLIPKELDGKVDIFCSLVTAIAQHAESGHDPDDFGITLGRKTKEEPKIQPDKAMIVHEARRDATQEANMHWAWQTSPNHQPIRYPSFINPPFEWEVSQIQEDLYEREFVEQYFKVIGSHLEKLVPPRTWKNAFLICSLFDEMQAQKHIGRKDAAQKGWSYIRSAREHDLWMSQHRKEKEEAVYQVRRKKYAPAPQLGISDPSAMFSSPQVQVTSGAKAAFEESGEQPAKFLDRHFSGDFGEVTGPDAQLNQENLESTGMVMSIYRLSTGVKFWIITDDGHELSTILLPEEY